MEIRVRRTRGDKTERKYALSLLLLLLRRRRRCVRVAPKTAGLLTPDHRLSGWHLPLLLLPPLPSSSALLLQGSFGDCAAASSVAPLDASPSSSAHGGPRRCGALPLLLLLLFSALRCMLRTSLPLAERRTLAARVAEQTSPLSASHSLLLRHLSLSHSHSLGAPSTPPPLLQLTRSPSPLPDPVRCKSPPTPHLCHLRTTATFINYASPRDELCVGARPKTLPPPPKKIQRGCGG